MTEVDLHSLIGRSATMQKLRRLIDRVAASDRPVLVTGPSGSGKELVAASIHQLGVRRESPWIDLNCAALPESLIESELFGRAQGAFTGADHRAEGLLSACGQGTLFLDEIAELSAIAQAKVLRVIDTCRFRPVGCTRTHEFRGRLIAATNVDLEERVRVRRFREDLLHRLRVLVVQVPPLADRAEDIPLLITHFLESQSRMVEFTPRAIEYLATIDWPGNVRQLKSFVERAAVVSERELIDVGDIDAMLNAEQCASISMHTDPRELARCFLGLPVRDKMGVLMNAILDEAMLRAGGNKSEAARNIGVHRKVVERWVRGRSIEAAL